MSAVVGEKKPTIKPDDVVRVPSGIFGTVLWINRDGSREIELVNGERVALMPVHLELVRAAKPRPWPSYRLPD